MSVCAQCSIIIITIRAVIFIAADATNRISRRVTRRAGAGGRRIVVVNNTARKHLITFVRAQPHTHTYNII